MATKPDYLDMQRVSYLHTRVWVNIGGATTDTDAVSSGRHRQRATESHGLLRLVTIKEATISAAAIWPSANSPLTLALVRPFDLVRVGALEGVYADVNAPRPEQISPAFFLPYFAIFPSATPSPHPPPPTPHFTPSIRSFMRPLYPSLTDRHYENLI
nr:hypothetical transcript [Hymenolepis microstoma]